jgi:hypothetical protein
MVTNQIKHLDIETSQLTFTVCIIYKQKYQNNDHFVNIAITAKTNITFHSRMKGKYGVLCKTNTF